MVMSSSQGCPSSYNASPGSAGNPNEISSKIRSLKYPTHPSDLSKIYTSSNNRQLFTSNVDQIRAEYSTASPISSPCLPSARSTSSSSYSPLMCGTLMVMRMSVFSFSSRTSVRISAVKSGAADRRDSSAPVGVCVAMSV